MKELLYNPHTKFYHLTTNSRMNGIRNYGLKNMNGKGISVVRTPDIRVLNSLIVTQLQNDDVKQENHFVLLELAQHQNNFLDEEIQPDIVDEWTWPMHNNIISRVIPFSFIRVVCEFSVMNWDLINVEDYNHMEDICRSDFYLKSFDLVYFYNNRRYKVNDHKVIQYL